MERAAAKILNPGNVLQRLTSHQPRQIPPQLSLPIPRNLIQRLNDMRITLRPKHKRTQTQNEAPGLLRRIQSLKRSSALPYKLREQH